MHKMFAGHTIRGSVGGSHHHHSSFKQRLKQLLQDHGVGNVRHLIEESQRSRGASHIIPFLPHLCVCTSVFEVTTCHHHSMLISVIQVCSFSPFCVVIATQTYVYTHGCKHTLRHLNLLQMVKNWPSVEWSS